MRVNPVTPAVVVLIVVHNRLCLTSKCLASIPASSPKMRIHIVLVDDGSTDGTSEWVKKMYPAATVLRGDGNLWFGGGVQVGLEHIRAQFPLADYVLSLNNDLIMLPGCVEALVNESGGEAIVSAILTDRQVRVIYSFGTVWDWWKGWVCPFTGHLFASHPEFLKGASLEVPLLTTAATIIPAKWLAKIAPINVERYPQHKADTDLFSKLSRAGARLRVTSRAIVTEGEGQAARRCRAWDYSFLEFLSHSIKNKHSPLHFPSTINSLWESAPSFPSAVLPIVRAGLLYLRTLLCLPIYRFFRVVEVFLSSLQRLSVKGERISRL